MREQSRQANEPAVERLLQPTEDLPVRAPLSGAFWDVNVSKGSSPSVLSLPHVACSAAFSWLRSAALTPVCFLKPVAYGL